MRFKKILSFFLLYALAVNSIAAGVSVVKSNGISLTGADGITYIGTSGISLTGADGFLNYQTNGISLTGADGISLTGADGISLTGADGATYVGANGISLTGADGISLTGADGISLTGADGVISLTGADGTIYQADSVIIRRANGISLTGADGTISLTGADGTISLTGADGTISLTGADGISLTGADGISLTGADSITGFNSNGVVFSLLSPTGISLTGADGAISLTGADGISLTGADGISLTGADTDGAPTPMSGLQSLDPELALWLNRATDDSSVNAVIVFHQYPTQVDLAQLQQLGITGGTLFRALPMVMVTTKKSQLIAASRLPRVRSIYGNRTLNLNSDPFFEKTQTQRIAADRDLQQRNGGLPVSGRNITVAVLDTGINSTHNDLSGKVVQNVRLNDVQSAPAGFVNPIPVENVANTDLAGGHGTFVAGVIAASGISSGGKYNGVAPGAKILGLSAGDLNLTNVLSGFDYILEKGAQYNVRVVNCSFSAATVYDKNDPINIATRILTERGVNVVFSAGNSGAGNGTLNPYAAAPWVVSVGATDEKGVLANFSSRGVFGDPEKSPSLVAPGVNIVSLRAVATQTGTLGLPTDLQRLAPGELPFYTTASGTSFSAPQVAGTIAMMLEANPNLTPAEIKDILQRSATPLPLNYRHEAGAGILNAYAAVLEAAFPLRKTGLFRATLDTDAVQFKTSVTQTFSQSVAPNSSAPISFSIPANALQSNVSIAWAQSANDFGMKVYDSTGALRGESNNPNTTGLTGRREKVNLANPSSQTYQAFIKHSNSFGATAQTVFGLVETSTVEYAPFGDVNNLPLGAQSAIYNSLRSFLMLPQGKNFRASTTVSRAELAAAFVRAGRVPQFVAKAPMYADVTNLTTRSAVESVQANPSGRLIFDAGTNGGAFRPDDNATRLIAAVAFVKAAGIENLAAASALPAGVADASSIPAAWRGYVAVALQKGFLNLDGGNIFNPNRAINRLELAQAMNGVVRSGN